MVWDEMVWFAMVWYGMVPCGLLWSGSLLYGKMWCNALGLLWYVIVLHCSVVLSCLALSGTLSCLGLVLSCLALRCLVLSCLVLSCNVRLYASICVYVS